METKKLSGLPRAVLRKMLQDTEQLIGEHSQSASVIRRELQRRSNGTTEPPPLTITEAAGKLGCTPAYLSDQIYLGKIDASRLIKLGNRRFVPLDYFDEMRRAFNEIRRYKKK